MQAGPAARGGGGVGVGLLAEERQAKFDVGKCQPHLVCCAAVHTGKCTQVAAAHGQHVNGQRLGAGLTLDQGQRDLAGALLKSQITFELHKAVHINREVARDLHQVALGTVHAEFEAAARAGRHRQVGLASGIVHHQRTLRFGCNDGGGTGLRHRERRNKAARHVGDLQIGHVDTDQAAAKTYFQRLAAEKFHAGGGTGDAGDGRIENGLHLGTAHVSTDFGTGHGGRAMGQRQGVADVAASAFDRDALQLTGGALTLGDIAWLDDGQAEVTKMAGDVGHIDLGQCALEVQQQSRLAVSAVSRVDRDGHIARANGCHALQCRLNACGQHRVIGGVDNGRAERTIH